MAAPDVKIIAGDAFEQLRCMPSNTFDCCITSPPYWGLRDYGISGQMGMEPTLGEHLASMVAVFDEVRRVLKPAGTCWINYGDCYAASPNGRSAAATKAAGDDDRTFRDKPFSTIGPVYSATSAADGNRRGREGRQSRGNDNHRGRIVAGGYLKPKDLCMVPNRIAIALQEAGWYVRSEIIWSKPNPMPESVKDRPTCAHEKLWLLTKSETYFYDADAIREVPSAALIKQVEQGYSGADTKDYAAGGAQSASGTKARIIAKAREKIDKQRGHGRRHKGFNERWDALSKDEQMALGANARNVWTISPKPYRGAHFATMPPEIVERCIKAGCPDGGSVLDPFGGSGTTGLVARALGRHATLIELSAAYRAMIRVRLSGNADRGAP